MYMLVSLSNTSQNMLLYQWLNNEFRRLHEVPEKEVKHMESWISGSDIYLITAKGIQQKTTKEFTECMRVCSVAEAFVVKDFR